MRTTRMGRGRMRNRKNADERIAADNATVVQGGVVVAIADAIA